MPTIKSYHYSPGDLVVSLQSFYNWGVKAGMVGMIVEIEENKRYPYRILFPDNRLVNLGLSEFKRYGKGE